jgi:GT2 family glycosyltransferase
VQSSVTRARTPSVGVVILSTGRRPRELALALATVQAQRGVELDVLVIGNGWRVAGLPAGVRGLSLEENLGVPEGRNVGAQHVTGDLLFFYDDDASLPDALTLQKLAGELASRPRTAAVQPRAVDPAGRPSPRRWVPRLRARHVDRSGNVAGLWEGVFLVRRDAFDDAGGWPGSFFYAHEGIELVWRLYDAGWSIRYVPEVLVHHPAEAPTRHEVYYRLSARNRVWVARRNLPRVLVIPYVAVWVVASMLRIRDRDGRRTWLKGLVEGVTTSSGAARPIRWRTVCRLTLAGRPPIV